MNVWIGEGRLVRDPELRVANSGNEVCNFTIAIDRRPGKNGEKETDFVDCTTFGKSAAFTSKYFSKGDGALVRGRLESRKYAAKDGTNRVAWGITVDEITFPCGKRGEAQQPSTAPAAPADPNTFADVSQDDIPF